jgi:hypothetical protein
MQIRREGAEAAIAEALTKVSPQECENYKTTLLTKAIAANYESALVRGMQRLSNLSPTSFPIASLKERTSSFFMMCARCTSTVLWLMPSFLPILLLLSPEKASSRISSSRADSIATPCRKQP